MLVVAATTDFFLGRKLNKLVREAGLQLIRSAKLERLVKELKQTGRAVIVDMAWEEIQQHGELRRLVNLARISDNKVICICPNKDEDLKKLAKNARPSAWFLRYDLELSFKAYLARLKS